MSEAARALFDRFRALPHSEQIATEFALVGIMAWARRRHEWRALDYGAGIGTVTAAIHAADAECPVVAVERVEGWGYGGHSHPQWVAQSLHAAMEDAPFSLVVIDDGADTYDLGTLAMQGLAPRAVVILEGNRPCERGAVTAMLAHVGRAHVVATWRPKDRSKGYTVVLCDAAFWERVWFLGVRLREGLLDQIARWRGIRPGWRRRDSDPHA